MQQATAVRNFLGTTVQELSFYILCITQVENISFSIDVRELN